MSQRGGKRRSAFRRPEIKPDLIIFDFVLPVDDGAALHSELSRAAAATDIPLLVLSSIGREILPASMTDGALPHFLLKPFKNEGLLRTIDEILNNVRAAPHAGPAKTGTIMIIEDDRDISDLLRHMLEVDGHAVLTSFDGFDALFKLGLAETTPQGAIIRPDVIILDVILPGIDGYTLGSKLKENDRTRGIPLLVLTAKRGMKEALPGRLHRRRRAR